MSGKRHERPATCTPAIYGLLCDCWDSEPSRRPGFDQIVKVLEFNWRKQVGVRRLNEQAKAWVDTGRGVDSSGDGGGGSAVATAEYEYTTTTTTSMVSDSSTTCTPTDANGFYPSIVRTLTAASPSPSEEIDSESVDSIVRQMQHADAESRPAVADGAAGSSGDLSSRRNRALDFGYGVMGMTTQIASSASAPTEIAVVAETCEEEAIVPVVLSGRERSTGKRTNPRTSASIQIAATAGTGASAHTASFNVCSTCAHLLMPQFGTPSTPGTRKFKPTEARQQRDALPIAKLRSTMEQTPDLLFHAASRVAAAAGGAVDTAAASTDGSAAATCENLAFWTARQYEDMLMMQPPLASPPQTTLSAPAGGSEAAASACSTIITAPLCERVASLKDVLEICLATELALTPPRIHSSCNFKPHMQTYVDPAIELIKSELEYLKADVASNPEAYRQLLLATTANAQKVYQLAFSASVNEPNGGDPAAYSRMMRHTAALESECRILGKQRQQQPTSELIPLVLLIRENIPAFKHAVKAVVAQARQLVASTSEQRQRAAVATERPAAAAALTAGRRPRSSIALRYRQNDQTKSPYRIIEKSLTKGPMQGYPDVRKVLDVFGCIIECADYDAMAAVVHGFLTMHSGGGQDAGDARAEVGAVVICRVKDRWLRPLANGWRDLILNVEVNGAAIFEVQVVLRAMVEAQTAAGLGPSHKGGEHSHSHKQVRCFTEVFALIGIPVEASRAANLSYTVGEAALARGTNGGGGVDVGGGSMVLNPTYDLSTTRQGGKVLSTVPVGSAQLLPAKVVAV